MVVYRGHVREEIAAGTWGVGGIIILDILYKTRGSLACRTAFRSVSEEEGFRYARSRSEFVSSKHIPDLCKEDIDGGSYKLTAPKSQARRRIDRIKGCSCIEPGRKLWKPVTLSYRTQSSKYTLAD